MCVERERGRERDNQREKDGETKRQRELNLMFSSIISLIFRFGSALWPWSRHKWSRSRGFSSHHGCKHAGTEPGAEPPTAVSGSRGQCPSRLGHSGLGWPTTRPRSSNAPASSPSVSALHQHYSLMSFGILRKFSEPIILPLVQMFRWKVFT